MLTPRQQEIDPMRHARAVTGRMPCRIASRSAGDRRTEGVDGRVSTTPQGRIVLERLTYDPVEWEEILAHYPEAEVFHSAGWLAFLAASQHAEPVVAIVLADGRPVGHFVGGIVRRFGVQDPRQPDARLGDRMHGLPARR